jgi:predicted MFS family arabinose efflux permease
MSQMQDSFLYASIILLLAFVFSFFLLKKETENVEIEKFSKSQIVSNVINVDTIAIMFIMGVVAFFLACMMIYFPLWSQEVLGWEAKENGYAIGFIGFIVALTQAIFIPLVGSKIGSNNLLIVAMIAFMLSGIFMVIGLTNLACILGLIFYALGFGLSSPLLASLLTINTKGPVGLVYGISESIKNLSEFIGPLFIGLFLDKYSLNIMFYGLIFFSIICFLISYKIKFRYNAQGI